MVGVDIHQHRLTLLVRADDVLRQQAIDASVSGVDARIVRVVEKRRNVGTVQGHMTAASETERSYTAPALLPFADIIINGHQIASNHGR